MKFLFQMDDPEKININEDSTYMLIKESLNRGIDCYYNDPRWVFSEINKVNKIKSNVSRLSLKKNNQLSYQRKILKEIDLEEAKYMKWESNYNFKRFLLTRSIEESAKNKDKTLTILLIARLIGDNPLIDFDLNSLITIRNSLKSIGFENLSKIITQEIMTSKIVNL